MNKIREKIIQSAAILFWVAAWFAAGLLVNNRLLLASPQDTLQAWLGLVRTPEFYGAVTASLFRISQGFLIGLLAAVCMASGAARFSVLRYLLEPLMKAVRAVPVASFVIIVLIWVRSWSLSVVISFLMVLPVLYENLLTGLMQRDVRLDELAQVYSVSALRRFRFIRLPQLSPHLRSGLKLALGLCWKSGIAAEVIGQPKGSIGSALYQAKVFFATPELFAWTITIVLISALLERLILAAYDACIRQLTQGI